MTVDIAAITQMYRCNFVSNRLISFFERKKRKFIITKTGFFIVCIRLTMSVLCQRHSAAVEGSTLSGFIAAIFIIDDAFHYTYTCTVNWKKKKRNLFIEKKKLLPSLHSPNLPRRIIQRILTWIHLNWI